jgi:hypothetical protein
MWKVKRMNTARIVVLAVAAGAGLTAPFPASGVNNNTSPPVAQPVAELRSIADVKTVEAMRDDQPNRRGETVNAFRYGVTSPTTVQK